MTACRVGPPSAPLRGRVQVPGDKSIGHRALMLNALADGTATITNLPRGADVLATLEAMSTLGVSAERADDRVVIVGRGPAFAEAVDARVDCANSGTTMRLLAGAVAGARACVTFDGDGSLRGRPMERVAVPLRLLGAEVVTTGGHAPLVVRGGALAGVDWVMPVASAQVKSAVLLAGLRANGCTRLLEPLATRDHTERMLGAMGVEIGRDERGLCIAGGQRPRAVDLTVPGDPSSAMFFLVAALLVPNSDIVVDDLCLNPTRIGALDILRRMGGDLDVVVTGTSGGEPIGSVRARGSRLHGTTIHPEEVPAAIDELPILLVAAAFADGDTVLTGAEELRAKESDRLAAIAQLEALGVAIEVRDAGVRIGGRAGARGTGAAIRTHGDHRVAMAFAIAGLRCDDGVVLDESACVAVSFPDFFGRLTDLGVPVA